MVGRTDVDQAALAPLLAQKTGQPYSQKNVDATIAALKRSGKAEDVQLSVTPEFDGLRVRFVLQPALYFGIYEFPGALGIFSYSRLLQVSNYTNQEPYSSDLVEQGRSALTQFFRRTGFFLAEVTPRIQPDQAHGLVNVSFQVTLNRRAKIGNISTEGASAEETARLQKSLRSIMARIRGAYMKDGSTFTMRKLNTATSFLQRELAGRQHLTARVKLVGANYHRETNRADVIFNVASGPDVKITLTGAHVWSWTRRSLIPIYQENLVNPELIEEGQRNLVSHFESKGYFETKVTTDVNRQPSNVAILYSINRGGRHKVEKVTVTGNQHFTEKRILSSISVRQAQWLSHGKYSDQLLRSSANSISALYKMPAMAR